MSNPGSSMSTESSSSEDSKSEDKENKENLRGHGAPSSKRNRPKKRLSRKNDDEVRAKGSDPNLKGCCHQCYGEPSRKPNQLTRTTNEIEEEFNKDHEAAHLVEPLF